MVYSVDFRLCVVKNISEKGMTWDKAMEVFSITRDTVRRWMKMYREDGNVGDAPRKPYKVRKIDGEKLEKIIEDQPDATLAEIAEHFDCWPQSIHKRFVKMGITRKKNNALHRER